MIPPAFIQDLLARVDIVELVGRQVPLKKSGINFSGLCPFHAEKSPSFSVSPTKQFYHCFGCGASGDAIRFLVEQHGMTFVDAVKDLAQQVGMSVPDDPSSPEDRERAATQKQRRATLQEVLARAAEHYRLQLKESPRAVDYLKKRGLTGEIAARFGLGYAADAWRGLASAFPSYDDPLLEESGMVIAQDSPDQDEGKRKRYDRFRDRIMFPIRSVQGEVIGFGGRVLDRGEPKYLNSPETPVFSKGRELYGLHEARAALRQRGYCLVVEGYMDVVAVAQSGFANAVATLGTACTAEHVQKLFRFTESVVFSFDGDAAGRRAATRALEASLAHATDTRTVRFLFLPAEHDPDSYVREHGAEAFESLIAAAVPLSRQLLEAAAEGCDLDTAEGRARLVAQARPLIRQLPPGVLRSQIMDALAARAALKVDELLQAWGERREAPAAAPRARAAEPASSRGPDLSPRPAGPGRGGRLRRPLSPIASSLDRAVWLLGHRTELWEQLGDEAHLLLTSQDAPHGEFFAWLDRTIHEHGTLTGAAVLQALGANEGSPALAQLHARVSQFHEMPVGDEARAEVEVIIDRVRLLSAQEELQLLASVASPSEAARQRQRELLERQKALKLKLSQPPGRTAG